MNDRMRRADRGRSRSSFGSAIAVPAVVKAVCGVVLAVLGVAVWQQVTDLGKQLDALAPWEKVQNYAIFYPRLVGNDQQELESGGNASSVAEARGLYPVLEEAGALYVDSVNYQQGAPADPASPWPVPPIRVNGNYLEQYPVLDESGRRIEVADSEQAWVVAVPERFKAREAELKELFKSVRTGGRGITGVAQAEARIAGDKAPERFADQEVRIIWMATGQQVFSFDPKVNPEHGNMITDPVIEIMTPANSLTVDRLNSVTGGLDTGLKVRVDGDAAAVSARLAPLLRELRLDDNLQYLVSVHDAMSTQVNELRGGLVQAGAFGVGALLVVVVLTAATVVIGSDRLRRRLTVRRLHGTGFTRSYRELLFVVGGTWLAQSLAAAVVVVWLGTQTESVPGVEVNAFAQVPKLLAVALAALLIEVLFVVVTARVVERRNAVKRLKEL
ncbi:hypothetical protein [Amycolatopsis sp. SID8362]|uniref:hypothetical protein n=1 Tax=Amycolatopsis sp. SID8362 TaxID=2690346 RepID=UPI00136E81D5|nr:hypothetical protein [Amycolatopsis sp. SID8362]NBH12395.1 hypothetical protein [Amycolatopsis sp. SID8362]NED49087.1 hypothetical protein [Amycolatopsis sp. SID8362]